MVQGGLGRVSLLISIWWEEVAPPRKALRDLRTGETHKRKTYCFVMGK